MTPDHDDSVAGCRREKNGDDGCGDGVDDDGSSGSGAPKEEPVMIIMMLTAILIVFFPSRRLPGLLVLFAEWRSCFISV